MLVAAACVYGKICVSHGSWDYAKAAAQSPEKQGTDFTAFYSAGELARLGKNIYGWRESSTPRRPFIYPPMFALFPMAPLSMLSHDAAYAVFFALSIIALAAGLLLLRRVLWPPDLPVQNFWLFPGAALLLAVLLNWRFIDANNKVGNANLIIFFLIALALYLDCRARETSNSRTEILSGMSIGLATVFKLTPGLFGVFQLWTRRKWALLGGALSLVLFLLFAPALWFGWEMNTKYLRAFVKNAAGKALKGAAADNAADEITVGWGHPPGDSKRTSPPSPDDEESPSTDAKYPPGDGVSLRGPFANLLTPAPALKARSGSPQNRAINILSLEPAQARFMANVCSLLLLILTIALTFTPSNDPRANALAWSLVALTMVLISPMTRIAHLVVLLLPVTSLLALLQQRMLSGKTKTLAWSALIALGAGTALVSGLAKYSRAIETLQVGGFTTLTLLLLYAAVAFALRSLRSPR